MMQAAQKGPERESARAVARPLMKIVFILKNGMVNCMVVVDRGEGEETPFITTLILQIAERLFLTTGDNSGQQ